MTEEKQDRSPRLLITLTIFGGAWFVFRGIIDIWMRTFSEIAYSNSVVNLEHAIAIWLLVVFAVISGSTIRYIYFEFKTYQNTFRNSIKHNFENEADRAFEDIFVTIKILLVSSLVSTCLIIILSYITYIKIRALIILIAVGIIISILILLLQKKIKNNHVFLNIYDSKVFKISSLTIYLTLITVVFSLYLMIFSISNNQSVNLKLDNDKEVLLTIKTTNLQSPSVNISIKNFDGNDILTENIKLSEDEITKSIIEVYESESVKENFLINKSKDSNYKLMIKKTKIYSESKIALRNYLLQGDNLIEITIRNKDSAGTKNVKISTVINLNDDQISIARDEFITEL